ncbi:MAG: sulfite exporter TauE/SafE family protein [Telluria sp.]|nr:sulfite exporter TauE/SafE family protein [Telluria sp.]
MAAISLVPVFMVGLLGSVHCAGMCGGIVGAFSAAPTPAARSFPVAVVTRGASGALDSALRVLAYNSGRIGSYAAAGALAGAVGGGAVTLSGLPAAQAGLFWLANLMLVALGLYLMDAWRGLAQLEALGRALWRRLQPLMKFVMPLDSPLKLLAVGALWGWLPCGMVYSVLLTAMLSGSAGAGAAVMAAFGLGTLPVLLMLGLLGQQVRGALQRRPVRLAAGLVVLAFGVLGLARGAAGLPSSWLDVLCVSPAAMVHR